MKVARQLLRVGLWLLLSCQPAASVADVLVISSNGENRALFVDPSNGKVLASLPTDNGPHDIAVSPDGRHAYIAITGGPQEAGHTITAIDLARRTVRSVFDLGAYKQPHDLRVSRDGTRLWVTCAPSKAVLEIDTRDGKIIREWALDKDGAWMLIVTPDDRKIYTANLEGKSVTIIDREAKTVRTIAFEGGLIGIDVSPDGREVWVHDLEKSQISVVDVTSDRVVATFGSAGQGAGRIKFTPDGRHVLVPQGQSRNLAVFEAASRRLVKSVPLSAAPKVITVAPDGKRAFITSPPTNQTIVVDLVTLQESVTFPTGKSPDGIAWAAADVD